MSNDTSPRPEEDSIFSMETNDLYLKEITAKDPHFLSTIRPQPFWVVGPKEATATPKTIGISERPKQRARVLKQLIFQSPSHLSQFFHLFFATHRSFPKTLKSGMTSKHIHPIQVAMRVPWVWMQLPSCHWPKKWSLRNILPSRSSDVPPISHHLEKTLPSPPNTVASSSFTLWDRREWRGGNGTWIVGACACMLRNTTTQL